MMRMLRSQKIGLVLAVCYGLLPVMVFGLTGKWRWRIWFLPPVAIPVLLPTPVA